MTKTVLEDIRIPVQFKLSALWTSLMFCYVYGDYFGLYRPGKLQGILEGQMGPLGAITQEVLLGTAVLMAIPSLMVLLSLILPPVVNRWSNVVFGLAYTLIILLTLPGSWAFYQFLGVIEALLTLSVVVCAWRWPRRFVEASLPLEPLFVPDGTPRGPSTPDRPTV